jgi:hypothetical protein
MTSSPEVPGPAPVAYKPARWKLVRVSDRRVDLKISTDPLAEPLIFPMTAEEFYYLVHNADRLISWTLPEVEGTFTQPVSTPEEVRQHLSISGYIVTSPTLASHTALVQSTAYASWVEEVPAEHAGEIAWFVNVFEVDHEQFWQACVTHGATQVPAEYTARA